MLKKLNKIAQELYSEINFTMCNEEEQELILHIFIERGYYLVDLND